MTATDMVTGDTSEFSACQTVVADSVPANKVLPTLTTSERFGASVSVDGDWAAVGQPNAGGAGGAVSILERNPGPFRQILVGNLPAALGLVDDVIEIVLERNAGHGSD